MADLKKALESIDSKISIQVLQKIQDELTNITKDRWNNEEGMRFLTSITGDYHTQEDMRIRGDFYNSLEKTLEFLEDADVRSLFKKELHYMMLEYNTRAVAIVMQADSWMSYWEHVCYTMLRDCGIWNVEFSDTDKQNSAFYLFIKIKYGKQELYKIYQEKQKEVIDFLNKVSQHSTEQGSINTYQKYLQPLLDKEITWK